MKYPTLSVLLACSALGACMGAPPYMIQTAYNEADFTPYKAPGDATLHGQAFLKTVGGDVKTCAGNAVYLMPATAYNLEIISAPGSSYANRDARSAQFTQQTTCDGEGRFSFARIAALPWIVVTDVTWGVPVQYGVEQQGGMVHQTVQLAAGENSAVIASQ